MGGGGYRFILPLLYIPRCNQLLPSCWQRLILASKWLLIQPWNQDPKLGEAPLPYSIDFQIIAITYLFSNYKQNPLFIAQRRLAKKSIFF